MKSIPSWVKNLKFKKIKFHDNYADYLEPEQELKAGDVLLLKSGEYVLVGHVNKNLGVCDDCTNFTFNDIDKIATIEGF
jgi:hypothetical protein